MVRLARSGAESRRSCCNNTNKITDPGKSTLALKLLLIVLVKQTPYNLLERLLVLTVRQSLAESLWEEYGVGFGGVPGESRLIG